jgi:L-asparagine oxygenase
MTQALTAAIPRVRLPDGRRGAWAERAEHLAFDEFGPWDQFLVTSKADASELLPQAAKDALAALAAHDVCAVQIDNLPTGRFLPPPPEDGYRPRGKDCTSEAVLTGVVGQVTDPFGYLQEKSGRLVHEVAPVVGREAEKSNAGRALFSAHVDNAFLPYSQRPHVLALLGLVNEANVSTWIYPVDDLIATLRPAEVDALLQPEFRLRCPASFRFSSPIWVDNRPLLEEIDGVIMAGFNHGYNVEATTDRAARAYAAICDSIEKTAPIQICVAPGTALVFSNCRVLHARPPIEQGARWLQRAYGTNNLKAMQHAAGSKGRIFDSRRFL